MPLNASVDKPGIRSDLVENRVLDSLSMRGSFALVH